MLKRLEGAGLLHRERNPENERQVLVKLTEKGDALRTEAGCLGEALLATSGDTAQHLAALNADVRRLRDAIYAKIGRWSLSGD